ncbi:MAG: hypothetical protein ACPLXP_02850, partial [Microgenomates group bacterium]
INLGIIRAQQQVPLLNQEKAYLSSLPLREDVTPQLFQERYEDYQEAQAQAFLDCYQLAERILGQFFALEVEESKFPSLAREKERLRRRFEHPTQREPEWKSPEERMEALGNILQANREFERLSEEKRILGLGLSLVHAALNIYQVQQSIEELRRSRATDILFLLTTEEARSLMEPINNVNDIIGNFVHAVLEQCGGQTGVMYDLSKLYESRTNQS